MSGCVRFRPMTSLSEFTRYIDPFEEMNMSVENMVANLIVELKTHGFSQLPVLDGDKLCGIVHEVDLLRHLAENHGSTDCTIGEANLIVSDYATVTTATKVELLQGVLSEAKIALVLDGDKLTGVITKIDLIDFLAANNPG